MNFLELCQEMAREGGISGGIVSVVDQQGEAQRVVRWVARAYKYIQNLHGNWDFLRRDVEFVAQLGMAKYTPAATGLGTGAVTFGRWCFVDAWRCYLTTAGYADEQPIEYVPYDQFRRVYAYGNSRLQPGRPQVMTVAPDESLIFWPLPDDSYTVVGEYYRAPHILAADADVPVFPAQHHDAIMYRALMIYGEFEGDATVIGTGQTEFERELAVLEDKYLPSLNNRTTRPLA